MLATFQSTGVNPLTACETLEPLQRPGNVHVLCSLFGIAELEPAVLGAGTALTTTTADYVAVAVLGENTQGSRTSARL